MCCFGVVLGGGVLALPLRECLLQFGHWPFCCEPTLLNNIAGPQPHRAAENRQDYVSVRACLGASRRESNTSTSVVYVKTQLGPDASRGSRTLRTFQKVFVQLSIF